VIRKIIIAVLLLGLVGAGVAIYMWNKKEAKTEDVKSDAIITAAALSKEYSADEKIADTKYLNKNIEVSGTISEVDKNQDGGIMLVLQSDDPTTGVQCAMRDSGIVASKGQVVTIKGFCSGNSITGVSLTRCAIKK